MAGLLGCCWWLQARARDCGQGRARTAARCISQQLQTNARESCCGILIWCGLVCACVLVCMHGCARGGDGGERNEVAGTTWRSESLESGVWSFVVEESGWFEARGDENVPAVPIQTHRLTLPACQPPQPQSYQSCIAKCSSCHGERNMADIYAKLRERPGLAGSGSDLIAMHLAASTCLVRPSRASFCVLLGSFPSPSTG